MNHLPDSTGFHAATRIDGVRTLHNVRAFPTGTLYADPPLTWLDDCGNERRGAVIVNRHDDGNRLLAASRFVWERASYVDAA